MGDKTGIEWTDATWNPTTGCDQVSAGCDNCYALSTAKRMKAMGAPAYQRDGDPKTSGPGFGLTMHPSRLDQPIRWTKPKRIFVNSMSDLFHADVTDEFIAQVWAVMALTPRHTFQVLTKRHGRLRALLSSARFRDLVHQAGNELMGTHNISGGQHLAYPLPNVWVGVSVEDQAAAKLRIPALLETPAAVRFLSCEPLLGPVDLTAGFPSARPTGGAKLDWVIVGGESGAKARPMHPAWARQLRDQCAAAGVPFLFKQWGEWAPHKLDGGIPEHINHKLSANRFQYDSVRFDPHGLHYKANLPDNYSLPGMTSMLRVGKKSAGRELDRRTWDQYPAEF